MNTLFGPALIASYIVGSVPTSYILTKWTTGLHLDAVGSKNTGVANTFRHAPRWVGYIAVLSDIAKVFLVLAILPRLIELERPWVYGLLLALMVGNMYPVFLRFHGSKARTISLWGLLYLSPYALVVLVGLWGLVFALTKSARHGSFAAAAALAPVLYAFERSGLILAFSLAAAALLATNNDKARDDFEQMQKQRRRTHGLSL